MVFLAELPSKAIIIGYVQPVRNLGRVFISSNCWVIDMRMMCCECVDVNIYFATARSEYS